MKHGCCSKKRVIKGENEDEFNEFVAEWMDDYRPRNKSEREMVEQAAVAQWIQKRNMNRYHELEQSLQEKKAIEWTEEEHKEMERFIRYRTTAERSFGRQANLLEQVVKRRRKRVKEREEEETEQAETEHAETEQGVEKVGGAMQKNPEIDDIEVGAIHVLDQWADVTIENGRAVTRLEPSTEQLLEDVGTMKPPPEQVRRFFTFYDGIPEEYGWCAGVYEQIPGKAKYGEQQITVETWLEAVEREKAAGTGHLSDTGEDLPEPKRRTWCWCKVCARRQETIWRRERERKEGEGGEEDL
jgi:hypothetical protein